MIKIYCCYLLIILSVIIISIGCNRQNPKVLVKTSLGDIVIEIYEKKAPVSATNFLRYVKENRFQGATFYRTVRMDNQPNNDVKIEVIQGGLKGDTHPQSLPPIGHETTNKTGILHKNGVISMARNEPGKKFKGEIVFVGYSISAPDKGLGEYKNMDVRNKFVFVFKGSPADVEAPRGFFSPKIAEVDSVEKWEVESQDSTKIMVAYEKGAAGIIFYNPESEQGFPFRRESLENSPFTRDFVIVSDVNERVFHWIFWKDPQESSGGFEQRMRQIQLDIKLKKVRSFATGIKAEIKGFDNTTLYGKKFGNHICKNVIAKITGTNPELKNEYTQRGEAAI